MGEELEIDAVTEAEEGTEAELLGAPHPLETPSVLVVTEAEPLGVPHPQEAPSVVLVTTTGASLVLLVEVQSDQVSVLLVVIGSTGVVVVDVQPAHVEAEVVVVVVLLMLVDVTTTGVEDVVLDVQSAQDSLEEVVEVEAGSAGVGYPRDILLASK